VLLRHVQVDVIDGVDFELVVARMGSAAGVGCAQVDDPVGGGR
jgi:hypothetical protein